MSGGPEEKVCPRCGLPFSYIERRKVKDRTYLYAVHVGYFMGRREIKKCYLGPAGSYDYVNRMHQLGLTNLLDKSQYLDAVHESIQKVLRTEDPDLIAELYTILNKYATRAWRFLKRRGYKK